MPDTYTSQFSGEEIDAALRAAQIISGADTPAALREKLEIYGSNTALSPTDPTTVETALKYRSNPNLLEKVDSFVDCGTKVIDSTTAEDYMKTLDQQMNGNAVAQ